MELIIEPVNMRNLICQQQKRFRYVPPIVVPPIVVNNQIEEIAYFNSYLLPLSQKANIQTALDTYGSVRLEQGDYSGVNIYLASGQKLYGHPTVNDLSYVYIDGDVDGAYLENISSGDLIFTAGASLTNSTFKNIYSTTLKIQNGGIVEDCTFINLERCSLLWDFSIAGYYRNNKFIKHWIQGNNPLLTLKGNSITPSYGNVTLWENLLTAPVNGTIIDNLQNITMVGVDSETWNYTLGSANGLFYMTNMGNVKLSNLTGGAGTSTPVWDIEADNLLILEDIVGTNGETNIARANTNVISIKGSGDDYSLEGGSTGFDFKTKHNNSNTYLNDVLVTAEITNSTDIAHIKSIIQDTEHTPWTRPNWEAVPNPTGATWSTDRIGQIDSTEFIQNLIDTNGIAKLDEGIYYISSTLNISFNDGIVGAGTGKTAIVGLTDDFPLVRFSGNGVSAVYTLAHLTLQGGSIGLLCTAANPNLDFQITGAITKFVVFRNQNYGFSIRHLYGVDNNFFDNLIFIDCNKGFYQDPERLGVQYEYPTMTYIDKTVFYKNQFINCGIGVEMEAERANNLIAWIDCKFDSNEVAGYIGGTNGAFYANCDFTNNTGDYVTYQNSRTNYYACNFSGNTTTNIFFAAGGVHEACNFLDNGIPIFSNLRASDSTLFNCVVNSTLGNMTNGTLVNSTMSESEINKLLVNYTSGISTVLINETPNPYPQLLVTQ